MCKRVSRIAWLALTLVACSKPAKPEKQAVVLPPDTAPVAAAAPAPTAPAATATCNLAPNAEVSKLLGLGELTGPAVQQQGNVTICQYGDAANPQRVMIRIESGRSAKDMDRTKQMFEQSGQAISLVPGLGDAALSMSATAADGVHSMVLAFKGSRTIQVAAPATADKVQAVTRQLVDKL